MTKIIDIIIAISNGINQDSMVLVSEELTDIIDFVDKDKFMFDKMRRNKRSQ